MKYDLPILIPAAYWHIRERVAQLIGRIRYKILCYFWGIEHGKSGEFTGTTIIRTARKGQIKLGDKVVFVSRSTRNVVGLTQPTILDTMRGGKIIIGNQSGFSSVAISSKTSVVVGDRVLAGGNLRVFDHDFHSVKYSHLTMRRMLSLAA